MNREEARHLFAEAISKYEQPSDEVVRLAYGVCEIRMQAYRKVAPVGLVPTNISCPKHGYHCPELGTIRPEVAALAERGSVSLEEWKTFRGNSYEMELILPKLTDEALIYAGEIIISNCQFDQRRPYGTYNDAAMGLLAPELLKRLRHLNEEMERMMADAQGDAFDRDRE